MKYILVFLLLLSGVAYGQTTYFIRADTTKLQKVGASNELVLLNDTRDTLGALVNIGGGKTAFQRFRQSGDTLFLGLDTVIIVAGGAGFENALTPPQITADQNNYNPTGLAAATVLRLDADAAWSITGLESGVEGRVVVIHNIGSENITLPSEDGGSDAENQFLFNQSVVLAANTSVLLRYDGTSEKWRNVANNVSSGVVVYEETNLYTPSINGQGQFGLSGGLNIMLGDSAGVGASNVENALFLGTYAGYGAENAVDGIFLGYFSGFGATNANDGIFIGNSTGENATDAQLSIFMGNGAGNEADSAYWSIFMGVGPGYRAYNANNAIFMGQAAGDSAYEAHHTVALGQDAGGHSHFAHSSVFLGPQSGYYADSADNAIMIGHFSGFTATRARQSIFMGDWSGYLDNVANDTADYSILIGRRTNTGGFSNSILLGGSIDGDQIANTNEDQFMLAPNISRLRLHSFDYDISADTLATRAYARSVSGGGGGMTNPMTTTGDIIYSSDGSGTPARLGIGTSGQILAVSAGGIPEWVTGGLGTGTVTSVALASGTSGTDVNISGSPITTSGTITLNIPDASATARGLVTTGAQTFGGAKTFPTLVATSAIITSNSGSSAANMGIIGNNTSTAVSGAQFQVEGSTNTNLRMYMYGNSATTLGVGNNYATAVIGGSLLTEAASGTHPLLSSVIIKAPGITGGSATVTNTATLYIEGAPSATVSGVNTALYVAAGGVRFGGIGGAGMVQSDADGDLSVTSFTALTTYTPTLTGISNVTTLTPFATNYIRMGNMFWIFGEVEIEPVSTGATSFGFSLPLSTEVANSFEWAGTASDALGNVYKIFGDIANERVTFESTINAATTQKLSFTIMGKFIAP